MSATQTSRMIAIACSSPSTASPGVRRGLPRVPRVARRRCGGRRDGREVAADLAGRRVERNRGSNVEPLARVRQRDRVLVHDLGEDGRRRCQAAASPGAAPAIEPVRPRHDRDRGASVAARSAAIGQRRALTESRACAMTVGPGEPGTAAVDEVADSARAWHRFGRDARPGAIVRAVRTKGVATAEENVVIVPFTEAGGELDGGRS